MSQSHPTDPVPRATPGFHHPVAWAVSRRLKLEPGVAPLQVDLAEVLASRRSARAFSRVELSDLGGWLWHSCRTLETSSSPFGFELNRRPAPSAGAIHPIHLLISSPALENWARYEPRDHQLELLEVKTLLAPLLDRSRDFIDPGEGTVIAFVAETGRTAAKYENSASLIWRDAGVLQGILATVASALRLDFCLLGATGEPWVSRLAQQNQLLGVGLSVLGGRRT